MLHRSSQLRLERDRRRKTSAWAHPSNFRSGKPEVQSMAQTWRGGQHTAPRATRDNGREMLEHTAIGGAGGACFIVLRGPTTALSKSVRAQERRCVRAPVPACCPPPGAPRSAGRRLGREKGAASVAPAFAAGTSLTQRGRQRIHRKKARPACCASPRILDKASNDLRRLNSGSPTEIPSRWSGMGRLGGRREMGTDATPQTGELEGCVV